MREKIKKIYNWFINTKIGNLIIKTHVIYLVLPIIFYLLKAVLYNRSHTINHNGHTFNMTIDKKIPFIKYFFVFYFSYYFMPQVLLWLTSFYDKKKYWKLFISIIISTIIANIIFRCYQVMMIRQPGYPCGITLSGISNISDFFDYCIDWIYLKDCSALNCFPSIHCILGTMMALTGIHFKNVDGKKLPLFIRVIAIVLGVGCNISTVFIKQHYFVDMIAGTVLMIIIYILVLVIYEKLIKKKNKIIENEQIES